MEKEEYEQLKEQLKKEIIEELKAMMSQSKKPTTAPTKDERQRKAMETQRRAIEEGKLKPTFSYNNDINKIRKMLGLN